MKLLNTKLVIMIITFVIFPNLFAQFDKTRSEALTEYYDVVADIMTSFNEKPIREIKKINEHPTEIIYNAVTGYDQTKFNERIQNYTNSATTTQPELDALKENLKRLERTEKIMNDSINYCRLSS